MQREWGQTPLYVREGGTMPVRPCRPYYTSLQPPCRLHRRLHAQCIRGPSPGVLRHHTRAPLRTSVARLPYCVEAARSRLCGALCLCLTVHSWRSTSLFHGPCMQCRAVPMPLETAGIPLDNFSCSKRPPGTSVWRTSHTTTIDFTGGQRFEACVRAARPAATAP